MAKINELGNRYSSLLVIGDAPNNSHGDAMWSVKCDCGTVKNVDGRYLRSGETKSCGCMKSHPTHRLSRTDEYRTWVSMIQRCTNPMMDSYKHYGKRGITVCDRWRNSFETFLADMGDKPPGMSIERMNNDLGYSPDNCKWANATEQSRNRSVTRLNEVAAVVIRYMHSKGVSQTKLAKLHNVSLMAVHSIIINRTWKVGTLGLVEDRLMILPPTGE